MTIFTKKLYLPISMSIVLLICGCAKYNPKPLTPIGLNQKIEVQNNIQAVQKPLTEEECKMFFDRRVIKAGYQPIQISIRNNSTENYVLNSNNIDLPLVSIQDVTKKLHRNPITKGLKYFIIAGPLLGAFEGLNSQGVNNKITSDFNTRCLDETKIVHIKPNQSLNTVVFIPKNQTKIDSFDLKLTNPENNKSVTLHLS